MPEDTRPLPKLKSVGPVTPGEPLTMLGGQFGQSKYDAGMSPYQQWDIPTNRAKQQSNWLAFGNALAQSVVGEVIGGALESTGSIMDFITGNGYDNPGYLFQWGKDLQNTMREQAPIYVDPKNDNPGNMEWWIKGLPNIATSAAMLIPGMGIAKGVGWVGKALRASELATSLAARGMGAIAMRMSENTMEAYDNRKNVYEDLIDRGYDADKATVAANYAGALTYKMNYANLLFDFAQLSAVMKPLKGFSFAQGKNLGVIDRIKAVNEAGYKVANRAIQDFGAKGILEGMNWWRKGLIYGTRYATPIVTNLSEGIEEVINNEAQQEGVYQADRIAKGQGSDFSLTDPAFWGRAKDNALSKAGGESFFWGVMGGVAFNKIGKMMNMAMDPQRRTEAAMQIANLDNRKTVLTNTLKTLADPEVPVSKKRQEQSAALFDLARNAVITGNDEILIEAMQSEEYQAILKKDSGITDDALFKKKIDEMTEDVRYIQDSYSKYIGKDIKALRQNVETTNMNMFGIGKRDSLGEEADIQKLATPENLHFNWLSNSRQATDYLVELDYFAHKNDQLNVETNREIDKLLLDTFGEHAMEERNAAKALFRMEGVQLNINDQEQRLIQAKRAKISKNKIDEIQASLKNLKSIYDRYDNIYTEQLDAIKESALSKFYGEADYSTKTEEEKVLATSMAIANFNNKMPAIIEQGKEMAATVINRNVDKETYLHERAKAVNSPRGWHEEFTDNNSKIQKMLGEEMRLAAEYGVHPDDTQEVRDFKIEVGTEANSDNPDSEAMKAYREHYGKYSRFTTEDQFEEAAMGIKGALGQFDFKEPKTFDRTNYYRIKGQMRALIKAKEDFDNAKVKAEAAEEAATGQPAAPKPKPPQPGKKGFDINHPNAKRMVYLNKFSTQLFGITQPARKDVMNVMGAVDSVMYNFYTANNTFINFKEKYPEAYKDIQRLLEIAAAHGITDSRNKPVSVTAFDIGSMLPEIDIASAIQSAATDELLEAQDETLGIKAIFQPLLDHIEDLVKKGDLDSSADMQEFNTLLNKTYPKIAESQWNTSTKILSMIAELNDLRPYDDLIKDFIAPEIKDDVKEIFQDIPMETYEDFFGNRAKLISRLNDLYDQLENSPSATSQNAENVTASTAKPGDSIVNLTDNDKLVMDEDESMIYRQLTDKGMTPEAKSFNEAGAVTHQIDSVVNNNKPIRDDGRQIRVDPGGFIIFPKYAHGQPLKWSGTVFKTPDLRDGIESYNFDKWAHVSGEHYIQAGDVMKLTRIGKKRTKTIKHEKSGKDVETEEYEQVTIHRMNPDGSETFVGWLPYMTDLEYKDNVWKIQDAKEREQVRDLYRSIREQFPANNLLYSQASPMKLGRLLFNHAQVDEQNPDKGRIYDYSSLSQSFQLDQMNQPYDINNSNVYLALHRGVGTNRAAIQVRSGSDFVDFDKHPRRNNMHVIIRDEYNQEKYRGQTFALVPTNSIHNGKHVYYAVMLGRKTLGDFRAMAGLNAGKNVVEAIIDAVLDPAANEEIIRELSEKIVGGVKFKPGSIMDQPETLIEFNDRVPAMLARMIFVSIKPTTSGSSTQYRYPFRISYRRPFEGMKGAEAAKVAEKGIVNKYGSFQIELGTDKRGYQTVGEDIADQFKQLLLEAKLILDNKPMRVDSNYMSHNTGSGKYYSPFFNEDGNLVVEEFDSYLHYLDQKRIVSSTVQGIDISGKRFYFLPGDPYMNGVSEQPGAMFSGRPQVKVIEPTAEDPKESGFGKQPTMEEAAKKASREAHQKKIDGILEILPPDDENDSFDIIVQGDNSELSIDVGGGVWWVGAKQEDGSYQTIDPILKEPVTMTPEVAKKVAAKYLPKHLMDLMEQYETLEDPKAKEAFMKGAIKGYMDRIKAKEEGTVEKPSPAIDIKIVYSNTKVDEGTVIKWEYSEVIDGDTYNFFMNFNRVKEDNGTTTRYLDIDFDVNGKEDLVNKDLFKRKQRVQEIFSKLLERSSNYTYDWLRIDAATDQGTEKAVQRANLYERVLNELGLTVNNRSEDKTTLFLKPVPHGWVAGQAVQSTEETIDENAFNQEMGESTPQPRQEERKETPPGELPFDPKKLFGGDEGPTEDTDMIPLSGLAKPIERFYDPYVARNQPALFNMMALVSSDILFDVLLNRRSPEIRLRKQDLKREGLSKLKEMIERNQSYLENEAKGWNESPDSRLKNAYAKKDRALHRLKYLESMWDKDYFTPASASLAEKFEGYFNLAFDKLWSYKIVNFTHSLDDVVTTDEGSHELRVRHDDNWSAYINPKDTVSFRTKVFLSRIAKYSKAGEKQMNDFGEPVYYTLDEVYNKIFTTPEQIRPNNIEASLNGNDQTNPVLSAIGKALHEYAKNYPNDYEQMYNLISTNLQMQRRELIVTSAKTSEDGTVATVLYDLDRQKLEEQILNQWDENFKVLMEQFYKIEERKGEDGKVVTDVTGLQELELSVYEAGKATKPIQVDHGDFLDPATELSNDLNTNKINTGEYDDRRSDNKMEFLYRYYLKLKEMMAKTKGTVQLQLPNEILLKDYTQILKEDLAILLRYVEIPSNVQLDAETAAIVKPKGPNISEDYQTKLGSIVRAIEDVMRTPSLRGTNAQALFIVGDLMDRMGINPNQDFTQNGKAIYELSKSPLNLKIIGGPNIANNIKSIIDSKVVTGIGNKVLSYTILPSGERSYKWLADSMNAPFGLHRVEMRDLAKGLRQWWPELVNLNNTNLDGESEYTVNLPTAISNMVARIRYDSVYRNKLLQSPYIANNTFLMNMIDSGLQDFALQYHAGYKMGFKTYPVKDANDYIYPAMAFSFFQNGEANGKYGKRVNGRFVTQHGESHVTGAIKARKIEVDGLTMQKGENGKIRIVLDKSDEINNVLYGTLAGIFRNEVNKVAVGYRVFESVERILDLLVERNPDTPRAELVKEAAVRGGARLGALEGYHFHIKGDKLVRGASTHFALFGKDMFNDTKKVIYDDNGKIRQELLGKSGINPEVAIKRVLDAYIDDMVTDMVDRFVNNYAELEVATFDEYRAPGSEIIDFRNKYPLFDNDYVITMQALLQGRVDLGGRKRGEQLLKTETWDGTKMVPGTLAGIYHYAAGQDEKIVGPLRENAKQLLEYEYRYLAADFLLNHFAFKTSYFQLFQDPATLSKTETYEQIKSEWDKRSKHHLGPGAMTSVRGDRVDDVRYVFKADSYVHEFKVQIPDYQFTKDLQRYERDFIKDMIKAFPSEKYVFQKGTVYHVPADFKSLAAIWLVHRNNPNRKEIMRTYLNQKIDDGGSEITPREFLGRLVRSGELDRTDALRHLKVLEDDNAKPEDLMALRNELPIGVMKMIYSDQNMGQITDPANNKPIDIQTFTVVKNSESLLTPALAKKTEKWKMIRDLIKRERELLKAMDLGEDSFEFGLIYGPISTVKSSHTAAYKMYNEDGSYNGNIMKSTVIQLNREGLREQQKALLSEDNTITVSSQALPFSTMNVPSNMRFGYDIGYLRNVADEMLQGAGLTTEQFLDKKGGVSSVQIDNIRTSTYDAQTRKDWMDLISEMGIVQVPKQVRGKRDTFLSGLQIRDSKKFLQIIGRQMILQFGADPSVYGYLETFEEKDVMMRIPISETPFGTIAEHVIMSKLSKIISSRKTEGVPLIQTTSDGYHVFDRGKGQIDVDSTLKGYQIEMKTLNVPFTSRRAAELAYPHNLYDVDVTVESGNIQTFWPVIYNVVPAEIDVSWNFRGKDGELLDFYEYCEEDGTPKLDKFTPEMLEAIAYRIPNTGPNTIAYTKVRRFIPPSHGDMVRVPSMILTVMNSDLDVDKLYLYTKTFEIKQKEVPDTSKEAKEGDTVTIDYISDIKSVIHETQPNSNAIVFTKKNKEEFLQRYLKAFNIEYRTLSEEVARLIGSSALIKRAVGRMNFDYDEVQADLAKIKGVADPELQSLIAKFPALRNERDELLKLFNAYNEILDGNEILTAAVLDEMPEDYPEGIDNRDNVKKLKAEIKERLKTTVAPQLQKAQDAIAAIKKKGEAFEIMDDVRYMGLMASVDTAELDEKSKRLKEMFDKEMKKFDFSADGLKDKGFTFYDMMSSEQLQNTMMETFKIMFSSGSMLAKMTTPLSSDPIKKMAADKSITYIDDNGVKQARSFAEYNAISRGHITDIGDSMMFKRGSNDNSKMIGIMASTMRTISIFQRIGAYLVKSAGIQHGLLYAEVEKDEKTGIFKTKRINGGVVYIGEDPITEDNSYYVPGAIKYQSDAAIYDKNMVHLMGVRYRMDAFGGTDIHGNYYEVPTLTASALQAALDGTKDVVNSYINLNPRTVNALMVHILLRHVDEGVRIINSQVIKRFAREALSDKPDSEFGKWKRKKAFVRTTALLSGMITSKELEALEAQKAVKDGDALMLATAILKFKNLDRKDQVLSIEDLNTHLGQDFGDLKKDKAYLRREFMILHKFLIADGIGEQMIKVNQNLNTFNKGGDNTILASIEKGEEYNKMHEIYYDKGKKRKAFRSSVPNIGGISRLNDWFSIVTKKDGGLRHANMMEVSAHDMHTSFVNDLFGSDKNVIFMQATKMMRDITKRVFEALPASNRTPALKKKLHIEFSAMMNSNPELYKKLFTYFDTSDEYKYFERLGLAPLTKLNWLSDADKEGLDMANEIYIMKRSMIKQMLYIKAKYAAQFPLLSAFKPRVGKKGNPDSMLYMNVANLGNQLAMTYGQDLSKMFSYQAPDNATETQESDAKIIRALSRQIILYSMMYHGGINNPNSMVRHIDPYIHYEFGFDTVKRQMIRRMANDEKYRKDVAETFTIQFLQHYPRYAYAFGAGMREKAIPDLSSPGKDIIRYNDVEHRHEIHLREAAAGDIKGYRTVSYENRLFTYQFDNNIHKLVEIDNLGNPAFNGKEYRWNTERQPGLSLINDNITSENRKYKDPGGVDDAGTSGTYSDYASEIKDLFSTEQTDLNTVFERYLGGHPNAEPSTLSEFVVDKYMNIFNSVNHSFNPIIKGYNNADDRRRAYVKDEVINGVPTLVVNFNQAHFIKGGTVLTGEFDELLAHETTHLLTRETLIEIIGRMAAATLNPVILTKEMRDSLVQKVNTLAEVYKLAKKATTTQGNRLFDLNQQYQNAKRTGNAAEANRLRAMQVFEIDADIDGYLAEKPDLMKTWDKLNGVYHALAEFMTYAKTNEDFQRVLNDTSLSSLSPLLAEKEGDKSIWQWIKELIIDIIDTLTDLRSIQKLTPLQIKERSMLHVSLSAIQEVFNPAARLMLDKRINKGEGFEAFSKIAGQVAEEGDKPLSIQAVPETVTRKLAEKNRDVLYIVSTDDATYKRTYSAENIINIDIWPNVGVKYDQDNAATRDAFRARVAQNIRGLKAKMEKGKYKAVFMSELFDFGDSANPFRFPDLQQVFKKIVHEELEKAGITANFNPEDMDLVPGLFDEIYKGAKNYSEVWTGELKSLYNELVLENQIIC